jgi:pSer/pThr/pTyr-binding forkhead associated (FHA) protein
MIMRLQHQRPDGETDTYHLKPGRRYYIGRGSTCEVRILDLKLSRKHCAVEFGDGAWRVVDLLSTNGCRLNGEQIVGTIPLAHGNLIEAGQTTLKVMLKEEEEEDTSADEGSKGVPVVEQEPMPEGGDGHPDGSLCSRNSTWEPEPQTVTADMTNAPAPVSPAGSAAAPQPEASAPSAPTPLSVPEPRRPTAVFKPSDFDDLVPVPASTTPSPPPVSEPQTTAVTKPGEERAFFITVMGQRIGPLTRAVARELKSRELRGVLTVADLDSYPKA